MSWTDKTPSPTQKAGANNAASPRDAAIETIREILKPLENSPHLPSATNILARLQTTGLAKDGYAQAAQELSELLNNPFPPEQPLSTQNKQAFVDAINELRQMGPKTQQEVTKQAEKNSKTTSPWAQGL